MIGGIDLMLGCDSYLASSGGVSRSGPKAMPTQADLDGVPEGFATGKR